MTAPAPPGHDGTTMNTNDFLAVATGPHGQHLGIGAIVLALLVIGALSYGALRLRDRRRLNRPPRPTTRPGSGSELSSLRPEPEPEPPHPPRRAPPPLRSARSSARTAAG